MAGMDSIKAKLKVLKNKTKFYGRERPVSVVVKNRDGSIDWPENVNERGILLVPFNRLSVDEWEQLNE